jgi:hypothetical protein
MKLEYRVTSDVQLELNISLKSTLYELDMLKPDIPRSFLGDTPSGFHISLADITSDVDISLPVAGSIGI